MAVPRSRFLTATFGALEDRDFRWYWLYRLAGEAVVNLNSVAQGWLVYAITGSALALGWVSAGRALATVLIGPWGGVLCDRMERRAVLVWTRLLMACVTASIAVLVWLGEVEVWHLALATMLDGILMAILSGAQQAIVSDLVGDRGVMNALSLNALCIGVAGLIFPTVSGLLIRWVGAGGAYCTATCIHILGFLALLQLPTTASRDTYNESPIRALAEGFRYVAHRPLLVAMLGVAVARFLFGMSYSTFMPKFAADVLGFDAAGLGLLLTAPGLGALVASLLVASLRDYRHKGRLLLVTGVIMGLLLVALGQADSPLPVFVILVLLGACGNVLRIVNQTLLQINSEDRYRGRVTSLYGVAMGCGPFSAIPMGALADTHGVPFVLTIQGMLLLIVFVALGLGTNQVREAE